MNRSFVLGEQSNDGLRGPHAQQQVSPRSQRTSFAATATTHSSTTRPRLLAASAAEGSSKTLSSSSKTLRTANVTTTAPAPTPATTAASAVRTKKKMRKQQQQHRASVLAAAAVIPEGGEIPSKSTASPIPPSSRDPPLPPVTADLQKTIGGKVVTRSADQRKSQVSVTSRQTTGTSPAIHALRRDRSGLSRAQQQRLHASSPAMNYVHEAQSQQQGGAGGAVSPQPAAAGRTRRAQPRRSEAATATSSHHGIKPIGSGVTRKNSKSRSPMRRRTTEVKAAPTQIDRSEVSASSSRRMTTQSERSASSSRRRLMGSSGGLMSDRSDPTHSIRRGGGGKRRQSRKPSSLKPPSRHRPMHQQQEEEEDDDGYETQQEEESEDVEGEEKQEEVQQPQQREEGPHQSQSAFKQGTAMAARKQSMMKPQGKSGEKEKWWKSWSRLSLSGEKFLEGTPPVESDKEGKGAEQPIDKKKKRRSMVSSAKENHDSNLSSIELLQQLVSSDPDDSETKETEEDQLAVSAPTFHHQVEEDHLETSKSRLSKSTSDIPTNQEGTRSGNRPTTRGGKRPKDRSQTSSSKQRKAKHRKSKTRKKTTQEAMQESIADQSLTVSMLGEMDARTKRTEITDPVTDEASQIYSSMGLSSNLGLSMRSSGIMSTMSSLTGGSSNHRLNSSMIEHSSSRSGHRQQPPPQSISVATKPTLELESVDESAETTSVPTFAEDSEEGSLQKRTSRPVKELASYLNEFDDLDALFSQGLEAVAIEDAIEEASKETATKASPEGSPTEDKKPAVTTVSPPPIDIKPKKRKSRAGDVLKRFMKNFDDLDILFSRKVIKEKSDGSKHSKDDINIGTSKRDSPKTTRKSMLRRSLPDNTEEKDELVPKSPPPRRNSHSNIFASQPNILKEMLTMSTDDLENLFAKDAAKITSSSDHTDHTDTKTSTDDEFNSSFDFTSIKDSLHRKKLGVKDDALSKISEEPSSGEGYGRRSLSSFELSLQTSEGSLQANLGSPPRKGPAASVRESLTLEDLATPDLEDDTDDDEPTKRKEKPLSKSENLHEVRRKSDRDNEKPLSKSENLHEVRRKTEGEDDALDRSVSSHDMRRKAPERRKVDRSLSPPRRPARPIRRVQSEGVGAEEEKEKQQAQPVYEPTERLSLPADSKLGENKMKMSDLRRSLSPRTRKERAKSQHQSQPTSPKGAHRTLADRLNQSEGSMSPAPTAAEAAESAFSAQQKTVTGGKEEIAQKTSRSLPEEGNKSGLNPTSKLHNSASSLPIKLEPAASPSKPMDVLEILLERYGDYQGLDAAKASLTTDLLDIDYDTVKAIKEAKRANPKENDEKQRDRELSRRALQRTNSLKREAAREEAARELAAAEQARLAESNLLNAQTRGWDSDLSPGQATVEVSPNNAEGASAAQVFDEFFPPPGEGFGGQTGSNTSMLLKPFEDSLPALKAFDDPHGSVLQAFDDAKEEADSPDMEKLPTFMGPERRISDAGSFASYTVSRASAPSEDGRLSLPSQIGGPESAFAPTAVRSDWNQDSTMSLADDASWRHFDDTRSLYSDRPRQPIDDRSVYSDRPRRPSASDLRGFRYPDRPFGSGPSLSGSGSNLGGSAPNMRGFHGPKRFVSPWVDASYYGDEYYNHPNMNHGRNYEFRTINEFEAQYYRTHPHLYPGVPSHYGMYSSPDILHYDQGYGVETMHRYYDDLMRVATSHRANPFLPPGGPRRFGVPPPKYDGSRSMSLEDVFGPFPPSRPPGTSTAGPGGASNDPRQPAAVPNQPNHVGDKTIPVASASSGGSSSERRLSMSVHGQESEWEDFTEVARSGALQSIPWRSIRGLSYHQRLNQTERDRKVSDLLLDDSFHWRFHHAVSKACTKSNNEFCCSADCCCKKCAPPLYHRPAQGVLTTEEKEEDEEPSYKGRTVKSLAMIADSVRVELTKAADDASITYPSYDPKLDVDDESDESSCDSRPLDDNSLRSFG